MKSSSRLDRRIRRAALWGAALLLCFCFAPDARAETQVYLVQLADLVNMPNDCGGGSRYSDCTGSSRPGFHFTDLLPPGSVVDAVAVEFNQGVQCTTSTYAFEVEFNEAPAGGFMSESFCDCSYRRNIVTLQVPAALYRVRDVNTFLLANPQSCQGLVPDSDLGQAYARVTVQYTESVDPGGGGGGEVDLTPLLDRLDELEARLDAGEETGAAHVSAEHAATRDLIEGSLLTYLVEQDLARGYQGMTAVACLPEEHGGRLEETIGIVFETIDAHAAAGCNVSTADSHFQRGTAELEADRFVKACDWFQKAYRAANQSCP